MLSLCMIARSVFQKLGKEMQKTNESECRRKRGGGGGIVKLQEDRNTHTKALWHEPNKRACIFWMY